MEEEHNIPSTDVERAPEVIKKAKYEVGRTDILVCGSCHNTFYFIEELQQHRSDEKCIQESILRENEKVEPKEQVWAFTLWKNAILNSGKRAEPLTTWTLYKQWCNLNEAEREGWMIAGQNLQAFTKLSISKIHEVRGKTQNIPKSNIQTPSQTQSNELEEGEVRLSQLTEAQKVAVKAQIAANKEGTTSDIKKVPLKLAQLYVELLKKPPELRKALRTGKNSTIDEMSFEKILSRRFNHKNRCLEYYVKWDNMKESENTWEPKGHFERCKHILDDFDKVFNSSKTISNVPDLQLHSESEQTSSRPPRSSKQKARDQVKSWCDSMSDDEDEEANKKRLYDDDSDSSDSFEKKMKLEEETETSEDEKPTSKRVKTPISVNGIAKKSGDSTPQRIVRVSQKHLPNLSTGVYIMSKTEGIIKLNSDTSLPSSSPLLKVGQRIGQTHIKVVRKDSKGSTTKAGRSSTAGLPPVKVLAGNAGMAGPTVEEDESDGIPELEFPTDLPLPEPESPPGDFVLDPLTGKIAGQEYEEPKDNSSAIPESEPEQEPTSLDSLVKMAVSDLPDVEDIPNDEKVPTEVKESEVTSEKPDIPAPITLDLATVSQKPENKIAPNKEISETATTSKNVATTEIDLESAITLTAIEKAPPIPAPKPKLKPNPTTATSASILNAALTSSRMPQKKLLSATPSTIRQKIMPHSQMRMPSPTTTIIHKVPNRQKVYPQQRMHQHHQVIEPIVRRSPTVNTYRPASSNTNRRIGNTTIYKTNTKQFSQPPIKPQPLYKRTFVSRVTSVSTPPAPTPISMPLIGIEDEPEAIPSTSAVVSDTSASETELLQHLSGDLPTINLADTDTPLFITGEDGTIYQVAGQNEEGQTILISEGPDGQQQCVIVTTETAEEETAQPIVINQPVETQEQSPQTVSKMEVDETEGDDLGDDSQVVAQIVKADPPSPGGTRKVVLMLPDGNLMMTDVTAEQYAALELDK